MSGSYSGSYESSGDNRHSGGHIGDRYDQFREHLVAAGFLRVASGSFRTSYKRGNVVIKVPRNVDGIIDNRVEDRAWHKYKSKPARNGVVLAPCRLLDNGCLMMVAVEIADFENDDDEGAPPWLRHVEGWQVGSYRGKWVAYDYALDIPERERWEKEWGVESEYYAENYL